MSTRIASIIGSCALCAASAVWAATPVAVWDGDFSAESLSKNGWTLNLKGNALSADNSTITIDRDNNGVRLDADTAVDGVTVIVRYSGLAAGSHDRVLVTSSVDSGYDRTGIRLTTGGYLAGCGNASVNSGVLSNYGSAAGSAPNSGYMAFVYKGGTDANARGTFIYFKTAGGTYPSNSSWGTYQLSYQADSAISGVTLGGMRQAVSGWEAAKGMNITGIAVFEGRVLVADLNEYSFSATDYSVTSDTSVSALNTALAGAGEVNLTVSPDVTITYDTAFSASAVHFTSSGNVRFAAKAPPSATEFAKLDLSGVQGAVVRSWYKPGAIGFNFYSQYGTSTENALVPGGVWGGNSGSANGNASVAMEDGLPVYLKWSSGGVWSWANTDFMGGYLDDGSNKGNGAEIYATQLPFEAYDVIIYVATDSNPGQFTAKTVNGTTYTWNGAETVEGNSAWGQSRVADASYGVNALRVSNLSGPLSVYGGARSGSVRGGIAAIQIVPIGAEDDNEEIVIDATEGYTTTDSDMLGSIRTTYRNVRILGDGSNGATLNFGYLNAASMYISSHIVFDGGTHAVTIDGSDNSTIGSNASQPILEVLNGTTLDFYQHDLSGWLGSAAAKVPTCNVQVDDGGQLNIRLDGTGTTYYQGRYTICPGATITSYVTTSGGGDSHLRFNGGAVEGAEQVYVPASPADNQGTAVINGVEGNTGMFLASDETAGLGIYVGEYSTLDINLDIAGVAGAPLAKWGEGRLNLNGDLSGYAGTFTVNEGTVVFGDTTIASLVNNATVKIVYGGEEDGQAVGTKITSYSGTGDIEVELTSDFLTEIEENPSATGYTILPGVHTPASRVHVSNAPSGYSVHLTGDGMVLAGSETEFPEWTGASGNWTAAEFDGKQLGTASQAVFFSQGEQPEEAVTVTVNNAPTVNSITFLAYDTAYTLAPAADSSSSGITSTGNLTVSGLAPVRIETPLAVGGIALGAGTEFTLANESLTIPEGQLTGSGTFVLDPGAGKTNTMAYANTSFTGETIIKSGTVKMGNGLCFGPAGRTSYVRVKGGATLDANHASATSNEYNKRKNQIILEDGAVFTSSTAHSDEKLSAVQTLQLAGNAAVVADAAAVHIGLHLNYWSSWLELGEYTLTKTGTNEFFVSQVTITGTGVFDIQEGSVKIINGYNGSSSACTNGTIKVADGAVLKLEHYYPDGLHKAPNLTVKNLELSGVVIFGTTSYETTEDIALTVTGYITGNGTTPKLTLAEGAVFKPTGTGYLTVSESLSGTMTIDLSGIDMAHVMAVPLFKVGSVEMLPASSDLVFTASLPRGWKLAVTRDGCGYKLVKQAFDIRLR